MATADKPLQAGDLDRKIDILFYENHRSSVGDMGKSLSPLATGVWAKVEDDDGQETDEEGRKTAFSRKRFTVRYRTDVKQTMVIRFEGSDYDVSSVGEGNTRKQWTIIKAKTHD